MNEVDDLDLSPDGNQVRSDRFQIVFESLLMLTYLKRLPSVQQNHKFMYSIQYTNFTLADLICSLSDCGDRL